MKKFIKLSIAIVVTSSLLLSCGASRKYGCPSKVSHQILQIQTVA